MKNSNRNGRYVEIMDTTLRDGEQTPGVAFTPAEKLGIVRLLINHLHLDRLEIGSARVSEGERKAITDILKWAEHRGCAERMEILGFVDNGKSAEWIRESGGHVMNLLAKGSERHCRVQLRKDPARHRAEVCAEIENAAKLGLTVNVYLEDWTNGMICSFPYVYEFFQALAGCPVARIMLPDTLGIITPDRLTMYLEWIYSAFPDVKLDFHGHNDYGLDDCTSDYLLEGVMLSLINASRKALVNPEDYEARSNIMWCATMGLNKILALSKEQDWEVHMSEHQLGAYTDCPHGVGLAIISPAYYRYIYTYGLPKFVRYAQNVWKVDGTGMTDEDIALEGIRRLESFFRELGIPATLREVGATEEMLPLIAKSTIPGGGYRQMEAPDILDVLKASF